MLPAKDRTVNNINGAGHPGLMLRGKHPQTVPEPVVWLRCTRASITETGGSPVLPHGP